MTMLRKNWFACVALLLGGVFFVPSGSAQDAPAPDTVRVESDTVVIEMQDGRRILVYGEDGDTVVVGPDDVPEVHFRRFDAVVPHLERFRDEFGDMDFDVDVFTPDVAPLMETLHHRLDAFRHEVDVDVRARMQAQAEIARMDAESRRLAREVRAAEGAEKERLRKELEQRLDEAFEKKLELRRQRIDRLREKLAEEQDQLETRKEAREEIIERRLRELLGEEDELDW